MALNEYNLFVSDQVPGFIRSNEAEALDRYADLVRLRGGHHLGNVLHQIAQALSEGFWVKVVIDNIPNGSK